MANLSKDDGIDNDDVRKQWSDWLNEEKSSCCTCGTHLSTILWRIRQIATWNFKIKVLTTTWTHNSKSAILSIYISTALLPVNLQRALSTIKDARKEHKSQNSHHFPNVYFQVMFFLTIAVLSSLIWTLSTRSILNVCISIHHQRGAAVSLQTKPFNRLFFSCL